MLKLILDKRLERIRVSLLWWESCTAGQGKVMLALIQY